MKENFKALDGLRGLAALYVMIHHARLALTQSYQNGLNLHPEKYEWYDKLMTYFFGLFKFGHEAVIIFFVLSGFVIHLKQSHKGYNLEDFKFIYYLKKRIIRIYPTLLASFLLCIVLDYVGYLLTKESFFSIFGKYNYSSFFYNFFLIPEAPIWGNNFPVWSLRHEWFFYILYPFLLWLTSKHFSISLFIITGLYISYVSGFVIPYIGSASYTLMIWSLGCILASFYTNNTSIKWIPYLLSIFFIYPFINNSEESRPFSDFVFGLIVMGGLAVIVLNRGGMINNILKKSAWLGTFSYSIYLLHSPFLNLYQKLILNYLPNRSLPYHLWYVLLSVIVTLPVIYLIYYYTERIAINYKQKI